MAETQKPSTGWGGEVWLSTDGTEGNLQELVDVRSFTPGNPTAERVETTTLKTPNRRRTYTKGLIDSGEATIVLNARRGSDTYVLLMAALNEAGERYIRFNFPELGELVWTQDVMGEITAVDSGEVNPDGNMEITVSIALGEVIADEAYVS
ncbi:phage tail tube protein [Sphingopyxis sp. 550A]